MLSAPRRSRRGEAPEGIDYIAMILGAAIWSISPRDILVLAAAFILMTTAAEEMVQGRQLSDGRPTAALMEDPVVAQVGDTPIHLSEAMLAAGGEGQTSSNALTVEVLEDLADKEALAQMALQHGLDRERVTKAALTTAQREALSHAYVDHAIRRRVTEDAIREAYEDFRRKALADEQLSLKRIIVASEAEAVSLRARIKGGADFDEFARRRSLDVETRHLGGELGLVTLGSLPESMTSELNRLAIDEVSRPLKGETGWHLYLVDMRQRVRIPPYEDMRATLERGLIHQAIADAIMLARSEVAITAYEVPTGAGSLVLPTAASLGATW